MTPAATTRPAARSAARRPDVVAALPEEPGVYRFRADTGRVLYVGRAVDLRRRVASYWGALKDRPRLRRMMPQVAAVEALVCDSEHEAAWVERNLLEQSLPRWNRVRGGLEVPTYLRLMTTPRAARLDAVHLPDDGPDVVCFGPFLGGGRARLAVAAVERVLPLSYAARRLDGSQADMARVRGVDHERLPDLVGRVRAVLARDPDAVAAVRAELAARRTAAAERELFEVAAQVHEELEALDWLLAPQRVTVPGGGDLDLCGRADGVLLRFRVRAGRLDRWEQQACTDDGTAVAVPDGADGWTPFVARNLELAARLVRLPVR